MENTTDGALTPYTNGSKAIVEDSVMVPVLTGAA
jgi:hypothetical protein